MEHELDYKKEHFYEDLNLLLQSGSIVKIHSWSRAKDQASLLGLIKAHNYKIEAYTFMNFAKLMPNPPPAIVVRKPTS
jgi:hypothetical protein